MSSSRRSHVGLRTRPPSLTGTARPRTLPGGHGAHGPTWTKTRPSRANGCYPQTHFRLLFLAMAAPSAAAPSAAAAAAAAPAEPPPSAAAKPPPSTEYYDLLGVPWNASASEIKKVSPRTPQAHTHAAHERLRQHVARWSRDRADARACAHEHKRASAWKTTRPSSISPTWRARVADATRVSGAGAYVVDAAARATTARR